MDIAKVDCNLQKMMFIEVVKVDCNLQKMMFIKVPKIPLISDILTTNDHLAMLHNFFS